MLPSRSVLLFLCSVLPGYCLPAQSSSSLPGVPGSAVAASPAGFEGAAFSMSGAEVRAAAGLIGGDKNSDVTILYQETDYRIGGTGALAYTRRMVYRIETRRGMEGWAESSVQWDPWYQKQAAIRARVLEADGRFAELDQKTVTDGPANDDDQTYSLARVRKAPLPGLAVGAIVEEEETVEDTKPFFSGGLVYRYFFGNNAPAERERVVVELPAGMAFEERLHNLPDATVERTEANGLRRVVYTRNREAARAYGDIDLTSGTLLSPMVEFTTGRSWAEVARTYATLADGQIRPEEVKALLPGTPGKTRLETIGKLVQALHREVRYTGIEFGEAELVPQTPAEVLKRHYGDCKDKATLLVALLRAEGIEAHVALLSSGTGRDVNPELPGMNLFNHAIVYVPAAGKDAALWIDATAEFTEVSSLPYEDAGRMALVIAPGTTGLTEIPAPRPEDSVLRETRRYKLGELGPSTVEEVSETHGYIDATYRSRYGGEIAKKTREDLEQYAESAYLGKRLAKIEHGEGLDLTKPFRLTLDVDGARRGSTGLADSAVAIFPTSVLSDLPKWIKTAPQPVSPDETAEQKADRLRSEGQRSPTYRIRPYIYEQKYVIASPAGFMLRGLPPDKETAVGPGTLTEHYAQNAQGEVEATIRFSTGKAEMTAAEALAMRQAVAEQYRRNAVMIVYEEAGAKLVAAGKIREGLTAEQGAIAANTASALPHVRLARALLTAGVGDMARVEAAKAVALEPNSAAALTTQAWVLEHDVLGRRFGPGYDRQGALAAFRKALPLKSEDFDPRFDLAILEEFDGNGVRYGAGADLKEAARGYRELIESKPDKNGAEVAQYRVNLGYALLFGHEYAELDGLLGQIAPGVNKWVMTITSAAAQHDAAAGLAAADRLNLNTEDRTKALFSAGNYLAQLGMYGQAAALMEASIHGQEDAPKVARTIEIYKNLKRVPAEAPAVTSPESAVFAYMNLMMSGRMTAAEMEPFGTVHAYPSAQAMERDIRKGLVEASVLPSLAETTGLSQMVLRDMILGSMTMKTTGDDATGYRVVQQFLGQSSNMFVVKEDGRYRIVADTDGKSDAEVGYFALWALDHGQPKLAKSILDWKREFVHRGGGDDPLQGALMPRFWTAGSSREGADSPEAMRMAAISLVVGSMEAKPLLDGVEALREKTTGSRPEGWHAEDLDLLLARGYLGVEQPGMALKYLAALLQEEPDSNVALALAGSAYEMSGDVKSWKELLEPRLGRKPEDADLLRQEKRLLAAEHDYPGARKAIKPVFDSGKATASDYNNYAWLGLFDGSLGEDVTDAAQKATALSKSASFADLHTAACVYAAQGRVTEARQALVQAMAAAHLSQPNSEVWLGLGLLYEQYGLKDAALAAYRKVQVTEFDDHTYVYPESSFLLAQKGIARLGSGAGGMRVAMR